MNVFPQARKNNAGLLRSPKEKLLYILVNRTVIFLFVMSLLILFLYAVGTAQEFIDSTQLFLLELYMLFGIFLAVTSVFGIILNCGRFVTTGKKRYLLRAGGYVLLVIFAAATVLTVMAVTALSTGTTAG